MSTTLDFAKKLVAECPEDPIMSAEIRQLIDKMLTSKTIPALVKNSEVTMEALAQIITGSNNVQTYDIELPAILGRICTLRAIPLGLTTDDFI
jgi:hypothetical protein